MVFALVLMIHLFFAPWFNNNLFLFHTCSVYFMKKNKPCYAISKNFFEKTRKKETEKKKTKIANV